MVFLGPCAMDHQNVLTSAELKRCGIAPNEQTLQRGPLCRSLWWISEHHDRQLQFLASRATKAEASALQWLVALPPFTAPRYGCDSMGFIHPGNPAELQVSHAVMVLAMLAFSAARPCKFE